PGVQHVERAVLTAAGNGDARLVGVLAVGRGGIDGHRDLYKVRHGVGTDTATVDEGTVPERPFDVLDQFAHQFLPAHRRAFVAGNDLLEERVGKVVAVVIG